MSYTRAQLRTWVQRKMDAVGSTRWDTTAGATGEMDQLARGVFDSEWARILAANPYYTFNAVTLNSDASTGRYPIASLTTGSGDSAKKFWRVLSFVCDTIPYQFVDYRDWSLAESLGLSARVFWREGDNLMALPKQLSKSATITVNYFPTNIADLAGDGSTVTFPDGNEDILVLEWAAACLDKGGAEADTALRFRQQAETSRQDMLQDIARVTTRPQQMSYVDYAFEYGG